MVLRSLRELFVDELREIYFSETLIEEALRRMEKNASDRGLKDAFTTHRSETQTHIKRLEETFSKLNENPRGGRAASVKALLGEAEDRMGEGGQGDVVDAALIAGAQRVEHWEIASYGTAKVFAELLRENEVAALLGTTLDEEKSANAKLSELAREINVHAKVST